MVLKSTWAPKCTDCICSWETYLNHICKKIYFIIIINACEIQILMSIQSKRMKIKIQNRAIILVGVLSKIKIIKENSFKIKYDKIHIQSES